VEGDEYLLAMSRYIHLNPVRLKRNEKRPLKALVEDLRAYRWSSYRGYVGRSKRQDWMSYGAVESHVREITGRGPGAYRRYVERGLVERDAELEELLDKGAGIIATQEFIRSVRDRLGGNAVDEIAAFRLVLSPVDADRVLDVVCRRLGIVRDELARRRGSAWARGVAAEMLCVYSGLTQVEAGHRLGMGTSGAVSIRRKAFAEARSKDRKLDRNVSAIEKELVRLM
jgi:putative transposase